MLDMKEHIKEYAETMDEHSRNCAKAWLAAQLYELNKFMERLRRQNPENLPIFEKQADELQDLMSRLCNNP